MNATHNKVVIFISVIPYPPDFRLTPADAIFRYCIANPHFLIRMRLERSIEALLFSHLGGSVRDNEGAIPTFIQALFGIIDYVAIEVVEPLLPRVRLLKQWV